MADIRVAVDTKGLRQVSRLLREREDGKEIRRELAKELYAAAMPSVTDARTAIRSMPAQGTASPALRSTIAKRVLPEIHTTGRWSGARIRAAQTPELRGFKNAAKRTQKRTWRHPTFGRRGKGDWQDQKGKPGWFDLPIRRHRPEFEKTVREVLDRYAKRLAKEADGAGGR